MRTSLLRACAHQSYISRRAGLADGTCICLFRAIHRAKEYSARVHFSHFPPCVRTALPLNPHLPNPVPSSVEPPAHPLRLTDAPLDSHNFLRLRHTCRSEYLDPPAIYLHKHPFGACRSPPSIPTHKSDEGTQRCTRLRRGRRTNTNRSAIASTTRLAKWAPPRPVGTSTGQSAANEPARDIAISPAF